MDTIEKLRILADASQYDLSCACGTDETGHRKRSADGLWLYPVSLPSGGKSIILKTLLSNVCTNDCAYCPLRTGKDPRRCTLGSDEVARVFMDYVRRRKVFGLFLSSGVIGTADDTMQRFADVCRILRKKYQYRGYIHTKVIPGASEAAIDDIISLSSAVSLNVEVPTAAAMKKLSAKKNYQRDIVETVKLISAKTSPGTKYARVKQTTQFIVGAADETDGQIIKATYGLYRRQNLDRVYFSAYQRGLGDPDMPGEREILANPADALMREHRLYQCDWLMRKYGFDDFEIPLGDGEKLSLEIDPKEAWAKVHPEFFPININRADKFELLRVPGLGHVTVERILQMRSDGGRINSLNQVAPLNKLLRKANGYLKF